ncbi:MULTISPECIES: helix-turn-helix domain-containing protein [unclassified Cyanobium]|uniref:helix-turn-helix domain-containing protein n=1 Tax=unclassified Cyanobium TaxID=2627006 RepID=UPI0020CBE550|nr:MULTISPECIES: helix-turn-helix domain-containing protein [unclassified Cyanobium]MCP9833565.1 helix-turn-helix domain-containing protein [Cyanobium sp. La Preciosa 7G6]MCP9936330.1 helix-turn-helix domain-containing protein [Cyanobium sp. Aljojuca 7A6]
MAAEDWSAPIPQLVQLGETLGKARRDQNLSLEELANRLRLGTEQLTALEAGDHTHLPEAVFVVAQAKRVAGALGIDVSQQISDLQGSRLMRVKRRQLPMTPLLRGTPAAPSSQGRPLGWLWAAALLLGAGAVAMAALQGKIFSPQASRAPSPAAATNQNTAQGLSTAPKQALAAGAPSQEAPEALVLQSNQPSWLEVRNANGVTLFRGTFTGEKRFPMGQGLKVLAGRPDLVTATAGSQGPRSLGRIDQVVWRSFKASPAAP